MADYTLSAKITADASAFVDGVRTALAELQKSQKEFEKVGKAIEGFGKGMMKAGAVMTAGLTVPLAAAGKGMVDAASDYNENLNKINVVFGDSEQAVLDWASTVKTQFGLSQNQALEMTALFGDMATSMGFSRDEAATMSTSLAGLAGDLASFKNIGVEEAMTALNGIFTGETESMKRLGVIMTETNLSAYALKNGMGEAYGQMEQGEKVALRLQYVTDMLSNAQGDYANTASGTANSLRTFQAAVDDLMVILGQHLLPIITPLVQRLTELVNRFASASPETQALVMKIAAVAAAIGPVLLALGGVLAFVGKLVTNMKTIIGVVSLASGGIKLLAGAFSFLASPIGLVIAAIAAVVAGIVYLWNNCDGFRNGVLAIWEGIRAFFAQLPAFFSNLWTSVSACTAEAWNGICEAVSGAWQAICAFFTPAVEFFTQMWNAVCSVVELAWGIIITAVRVGVAAISAAFQLIWVAMSTVWTLVSTTASTVWAGIVTAIQTAIAAIIAVVQPIAAFFSGVFQAILNNVQTVFTAIGDFISTVITGIQNCWNGLKAFAVGVLDGVFSAVQSVVDAVKGFVNGVISGINAAIGLINMIPGVSVAPIPYLLHGTDNWAGGFARMNEGGRGELTYLPGGAQVIPHDISVQYAKEAARANAEPVEIVVKGGGGDVFQFYSRTESPAEHYRAVRRAKREVLA